MKRLLLALTLIASPALSADALNEEDLARNAAADGSLLVMGQFCNLPKERLRLLATKREATTLALASSNSLKFDAAAYREEALVGVQKTRSLLNYMPSSGPSLAIFTRQLRMERKSSSIWPQTTKIGFLTSSSFGIRSTKIRGFRRHKQEILQAS